MRTLPVLLLGHSKIARCCEQANLWARGDVPLLGPWTLIARTAAVALVVAWASTASAGIVITCPGSAPEEFDEPWEAPCVETCQDGSWRIRTEANPLPCLSKYHPAPPAPVARGSNPSMPEGTRGSAASTTQPPPHAQESENAGHSTDGPIELTREDLKEVTSFKSTDLAIQGYKLGDVATNWKTVGDIRELEPLQGLDIRVDRNNHIEQIIIEPEFADRLVGSLQDLCLDFDEPKMRAIFGVEDTVVDSDAADQRRDLKNRSERLGLDIHIGKKYRYARLGVEVVTRSGNRAALILTTPAARR